MVDFGCHGNVNFERIICTFLCIVRSDMDYLEFVKIVNSNFCLRYFNCFAMAILCKVTYVAMEM